MIEYPMLTGWDLFWIQAAIWTLFGISLKNAYDEYRHYRETGELR